MNHFCTAKRGKLSVEQFASERDFDGTFVVDVSPSQMFGSTISKSDFALKLANGVFTIACKVGDRIGLVLFSENMEFHKPPCTDLCASNLGSRKFGIKNYPDVLAGFLQSMRKVSSVIFFVTDFLYANQQISEGKGFIAEKVNSDAFTDEIKEKRTEIISNKFGEVDCAIHSLATRKSTDSTTCETYRFALKPISKKFRGTTVNIDGGATGDVEPEPASADEIMGMVKVMGGEDWELWMQMLLREDILADRVKTVAYFYLRPEFMKQIYSDGTISRAKEDLNRAADSIGHMLSEISDRVYISVNKAVVTGQFGNTCSSTVHFHSFQSHEEENP